VDQPCDADDGCGAVCGCTDGLLCCDDGTCQEECGACVPDCEEKECGDDGCGSACGTCEAPATCNVETGKCIGPVVDCSELDECTSGATGCVDDLTAWKCIQNPTNECWYKENVPCAAGQTCQEGACSGGDTPGADVTEEGDVSEGGGTEGDTSGGGSDDKSEESGGSNCSAAGTPHGSAGLALLMLALLTLLATSRRIRVER